jgi:hypothetical protein
MVLLSSFWLPYADWAMAITYSTLLLAVVWLVLRPR